MIKLKVVGPVAVLGGLLQIILLMFLCGVTALLCGARLLEGIFVGAFLSMSSTAVVVKFLVQRNSTSSLHGQVTIGILIFQDCVVGLLFALLPVLGGNIGLLQGIISMGKLMPNTLEKYYLCRCVFLQVNNKHAKEFEVLIYRRSHHIGGLRRRIR